MTTPLPTSPLPQQAAPMPITFGGVVQGSLGGEDQFISRTGARWAIEITTPRLKPEPDGRLWTAALLQAVISGERVSIAFPQPGFAPGAPGAPVVDGAAQAGTLLKLRGFTPGYTVKRRQFFSVATGGRSYLYAAVFDGVVDGAGKITMTIMPPIRVSPADGAMCEFVTPIIEGLVSAGDQFSWTLVIARVQGLKFTIRETR